MAAGDDAGTTTAARAVVVHVLDRRALAHPALAEPGLAVLGYVTTTLGASDLERLSRRYRLVHLVWGLEPAAYMEHASTVLAWTDAAFASTGLRAALAPYARLFDADDAAFTCAAKRSFAYAIEDDAKALVLGAAAFPGLRLTCLAAQHRLLAHVPGLAEHVDLRPAPKHVRESLLLAAQVAYVAAHVLAPASKSDGRAYGWVFEQLYANHYGQPHGNYEFDAFHRHFRTRDDVLYVCTGTESGIYRDLIDEGKPAIAGRWSVRGLGEKLRQLGRTLRLGTLAGRGALTPRLARALVRLYERERYYDWLFATYRPRHYVKVRQDMDKAHPIARSAGDRHGVTVVGYSCGSYPFPTYFYAPLDFHHYGLLGPAFKDRVFGDAWPDRVRYEVLGPFGAEMRERGCGPTSAERPVVGVFPAQAQDDSYLTPAFRSEFVGAAVRAAGAVAGRVIVKDVLIDPEVSELLETSCEGVPTEYYSHAAAEGVVPRSSQEVLEHCDVCIVMSTSTVGWEALGLGKRVVIYEAAWKHHPFAETAPWMVVSDEASLRAALDRLAAMDDESYAAAIAETVETWSKHADGSLIRSFVEAVEAAGMPADEGRRAG